MKNLKTIFLSIFALLFLFCTNLFSQVTQPNGLTIWALGQQNVSIQWGTNGVSGNVELLLYRASDVVATISSSTPNDGSHTWNVPTSLTVGPNYRVRQRYLSISHGGNYGDYFRIDNAAATPPTVSTSAASGIGTNEATLKGTVNPNGATTTIYF